MRRAKQEKKGEGQLKSYGDAREEERKAENERWKDVAAGYQQRTTKVIKLGWIAERLGQIGRPFNWEFDEFMDFLIYHYEWPFRNSLSRLASPRRFFFR